MSLTLEKIDPGSIPFRTLYTGARVPAIGLGTFGSDRYTAVEIAEAVLGPPKSGTAISIVHLFMVMKKKSVFLYKRS